MVSEGGRKQILIVDDDQNIRRFINESLRLRGYGVQSFAAALRAGDQVRPELHRGAS